MTERKILVDTHYLIWDLMGHARFSKKAEALLKKNKGNCYISTISYWEMGMLVGKNRVQLSVTINQFFKDLIKKRAYKVLPLTAEIGDLTRQFSNAINGDPADRIIVATAMAHDAQLMTEDNNLKTLSFLETI